jgi:hypothetical protein
LWRGGKNISEQHQSMMSKNAKRLSGDIML